MKFLPVIQTLAPTHNFVLQGVLVLVKCDRVGFLCLLFELVLNLDAGQLYQEGAIDHAEVRDSITATMEGGKEAFELRRRKYNF